MTELSWELCSDPRKMLQYLFGEEPRSMNILRPIVRARRLQRKIRLFLCACCRNEWDYFTRAGKQAVEIAEQYADGATTSIQLYRACVAAEDSAFGEPTARNSSLRRWIDHSVEQEVDAWGLVAVLVSRKKITLKSIYEVITTLHRSAAEQCALLREIFGNPFIQVSIDESCCLSNNGLIRAIASAIYENNDFSRLPILGDALEEVGCYNDYLLNHCRCGNKHVRGCWVVDVVLNKK